jgi:D-3-phosphoglycerate dehydrogenase/C-terminal binding protein
MKARVVITSFITGPLAPELEVLSDIAEIDAFDATEESQLFGRVDDADAIMTYHNIKIGRPTIERLTRCKLIIRCGVGYENVDHQFARMRNIPVANVPDYGTEEVADSAIGLTLSLTRGIAYSSSRFRANPAEWTHAPAAPIHRLRGQVFAIVGLGRIGTAAALRARAMGMEVLFYDPFKADGYDKAMGIRRAESIEELFRHARVVSLHCPLTDQTRHIVNAQTMKFLPRGAFLVNTARGAVVDTSAIPDAIVSGQLAGAGIDVLEYEPPSDADPLLRAWLNPAHPAHHQVIITPHSAFYSEEGLRDMRVKGAMACRQALLGQPLRNVVN